MKEQVKLPSGRLGYFPTGYINLDLEMKGYHYDQLTTADTSHYEKTVLSILKDLMDEDPYKLTQIDLAYVFTLVKVSSINSKLKITASCPAKISLPNGNLRVCGNKISFTYSIASDDDVIYFEGDTLPSVTLSVDGHDEIFSLHLPNMTQELELLDKFEQEGHARKDLLLDKSLGIQYANQRMALFLISNSYTNEQLLEIINNLSFKKKYEIAEIIKQLDHYGLRHKVVKCECKECGSSFDYRLPLFAGILM